MKKGKLSLTNLKVSSFVTSADNMKSNTVKGGLAKAGDSEVICTSTEPTPMTWCYRCPVEEILF